ncbi:MAG: hypothetical protein EHM28_09635 [Spirochaetaceae bacterium]|nr:MAG: hypothetical protein EHM28_09635 [Spirochaetaceae bacterium]
MMSNFLSRLIIVIIFIPGLFICIYFVPFWNHLLFAMLVTIGTFISSHEMLAMFSKKGNHAWSIAIPLLSAGFPAVAWIENTGVLQGPMVLWWMTISLLFLFVLTVCVRDDKTIAERLPLLSSSVFVLVYPGFLLSYLVKITSLPHPEALILLFLAAIFANDMAAYLGGKFLGRGKALGMIVSPKKTLVGFFTGFLTSIGICIAAALFFPGFINLSVTNSIIMGVILGIMGILGDLAESAMKRSSNIKDSGVLRGGRGGLMDAIDSLILAAPVFFYLYPFFAGVPL